MLFRLGFKELRQSVSALQVVFLILLIGFVGPLTASSLRSSVSSYLMNRSRQILSADLAISALRPFQASEVETIQKSLLPVRMAQETEFVTMARGKELTTLVEVKGVAENYPIYGGFQLKGEGGTRDSAELSKERIAWVFPEALAQLGLKVGESLVLGQTSFRVAGVLEDAPGLSRAGMGVAPRVYIGRKFIEQTGLTQFGSQISYRIYLELPRGAVPAVAASLAKEVLPDPDIYLRTPDDSVQGLERFFTFFNLYLVVITLVVFALSWLSAFYILQIYLQDRLRNAAILLAIGASRAFTGALYTFQIAVVMAAALLCAWGVVEGLVWLLPLWIGDLLPAGFVLRVGARDIGTISGIALASGLAFALPLYTKLGTLKLQALLNEDSLTVTHGTWPSRLLNYGPLIFIFVGLSVWLTGSFDLAVRLLGGIFIATVGGLLLGRAVFRFLFRSARGRPGFARLVLTNLSRGRFGTNLCFLSLVLVALSLNLVPHLLKSVTDEILPLQGKEVPALFLFNIPESSVEDLQSFASAHGAELRYLSPMILGRLMKVNGKEPEEDRFQRFPVRLSYRAKPIPSETVIEGREFDRPFDPSSDPMPGLSVEARFAERNGFHLGDLMEFDIQGLPIEGRIVNLRRVRWTDFNPNFFILFQPGVLDDAPKTYLANVMIQGEDAKVRLQYDLIRQFPDLSVIDIGRTVAKVLDVATSVIGPIRYAAWLAVGMSFLILGGVIAHNLRLRDSEIDVQKMMGASAVLIRCLIVAEYAVVAFVAVLIGGGAALILTLVVTRRFLDIPTHFSYGALALSFVVTIGVTTLIAHVSVQRVLNLRGASRKL